MVSLPPGPAASRPAPPEPRSEPEPLPEPPAAPPTPPVSESKIVSPATPEVVPPEPAAPEPPVEEAVSVAPQPKVYKEKKSLKKETYKPKAVAKAPEPQTEKKKKPTNARPAQVTRAIEKLRKQAMTPPGSSSAPNAQAAGGQSGGGWSGGQAGGELIDIYKAEIAVRIQQNWAFSEQVAGGRKDLSAVIVLKILPSGEIGDTWFEKRSGNSILDDSAFRAVQKSNPLPPLPKGYFRSFYLVGLIFTPEGIQ